MTPTQEHYVHFEECICSLNEAWRILQDLRATTDRTAVHVAAFRFALVAYARPYTRSDGEHRYGRNAYTLPVPKLSPEGLSLHQQILDLSRQVLAHSDLTVKQASVYVGRYGGQASACITSNCLPVFPEIDAVISLIERTLDSLYAERIQLKDALATKA